MTPRGTPEAYCDRGTALHLTRLFALLWTRTNPADGPGPVAPTSPANVLSSVLSLPEDTGVQQHE